MPASMPDVSSFFIQYETLSSQVDALFAQVREDFSEEVICKQGCSSCCHAMFDLTLVEALYLNKKFLERFPMGLERSAIIDKADVADRQAAKVKRKLFKDSKSGKGSDAILNDAAKITVRCPLLDENDSCLLYSVRPITCRAYGIPTSFGGRAHTCGLTGFNAGKQYPTLNMDALNTRLVTLSAELATHIGTAYKELHTMFVPVSTALVTHFDSRYLGVGGVQKEEDA